MSRLSVLVGLCIIAFAAATPGRNAYICEVLLENFCNLADQSACPADPTLTFGSNTYGFSHFNLVSFGGMYAPSGDVEGRAAIRNNVDLTAYSIGYQLRTAGVSANEDPLPYTMVVGGNAKWHGGSVHPDGSGFPYAGPKEYIFVGNDFSDADAYLQTDRTGSCNGNPGCLNAQFDNAQAYYKQLSVEFGQLTNNAAYTIASWGTIDVTCNSMSDAQYVISMTPTQFSSITFWTFANCNPNSGLIVNIAGAGSQVKFAGATQTFFANQKVLYNVIPASPTPSVRVEVGVNGNLLAPASVYNQPGMGVFIGQVIVADVTQVHQINLIFCQPPVVQNPPPSTNLCPGWESNCGGLDLVLAGSTYSYRDFNVISFQDFNADSGDVEGRLAVARDANLGAGYSVGYELKTATNQPDRHLPYSLIVGRDLNWVSGALYPQGNGIPYPGQREDMFVGRTANVPSDLVDRVFGPGDLSTEFTDAKTCYDSYQTTISNQADNVAKNIEWSALNIDCGNPAGTSYVVSLTPAELSQFTYVTLSNCNFQAKWFINIRGTGDVILTGGSFPAIPGGLVYNIIGNRNIYVTGTSVNGAILAPNGNLNQTGGVVLGKVVVGNVAFSLQINRENTCPVTQTVVIPSIVTASLSNTEVGFDSNSIVIGDKVNFGGVNSEVIAYEGNNGAAYVYAFGSAIPNAYNGQVVFVSANTGSSRTQTTPANADSAASVASVAFALFAALLALAF